jgi:hypothetical protein
MKLPVRATREMDPGTDATIYLNHSHRIHCRSRGSAARRCVDVVDAGFGSWPNNPARFG